VQLAFRNRENNVYCTPLSSHSVKHQQRASILATPVHLYRGDEMSHPVRLSVCLSFAYDLGLCKIGMPQKIQIYWRILFISTTCATHSKTVHLH